MRPRHLLACSLASTAAGEATATLRGRRISDDPVTTYGIRDCAMLSDPNQCCTHHDADTGQPCVPAKLSMSYTDGTVCAKECWALNTCDNGIPQEGRVGDCSAEFPAPAPAPLQYGRRRVYASSTVLTTPEPAFETQICPNECMEGFKDNGGCEVLRSGRFKVEPFKIFEYVPGFLQGSSNCVGCMAEEDAIAHHCLCDSQVYCIDYDDWAALELPWDSCEAAKDADPDMCEKVPRMSMFCARTCGRCVRGWGSCVKPWETDPVFVDGSEGMPWSTGVVVSDGTLLRPYCSWDQDCHWDDIAKHHCAAGICRAAGFHTGTFVSATNDPCQASITDESTYAYFSMDKNRTSMCESCGKFTETVVTASCAQWVQVPEPTRVPPAPAPQPVDPPQGCCFSYVIAVLDGPIDLRLQHGVEEGRCGPARRLQVGPSARFGWSAECPADAVEAHAMLEGQTGSIHELQSPTVDPKGDLMQGPVLGEGEFASPAEPLHMAVPIAGATVEGHMVQVLYTTANCQTWSRVGEFHTKLGICRALPMERAIPGMPFLHASFMQDCKGTKVWARPDCEGPAMLAQAHPQSRACIADANGHHGFMIQSTECNMTYPDMEAPETPEDPAMPEPVAPDCNGCEGNDAECLACQMGMSVRDYCFHFPIAVGCGHAPWESPTGTCAVIGDIGRGAVVIQGVTNGQCCNALRGYIFGDFARSLPSMDWHKRRGDFGVFECSTDPEFGVCSVQQALVDAASDEAMRAMRDYLCYNLDSCNTKSLLTTGDFMDFMHMYRHESLETALDCGPTFVTAADYTYLHVGHCAAGWIRTHGDTTVRGSAESCATYCRAIPECGYFAFDHDVHVCRIYTAEGRCPEDRRFPAYKSYRMLDREPQTTGGVGFSIMHRGHCAGGWLVDSHEHRSSLELCAEYCVEIEACGYFSYEESSGMCSLYSKTEGCPTDNRFLSFTSYQLNGSPQHCCEEATAECLSCARDMTQQRYCELYPATPGC